MRYWYEVQFECLARAQVAALTALLEPHPQVLALSIRPAGETPVFDDPAAEEAGSWWFAGLAVLVAADAVPDDIVNIIAAEFNVVPAHRVIRIADKNWEDAWQAHFPPRLFSDRLWVCRVDAPCPDERPTVRLDAGGAFGTGSHATTALCIDALCRLTTLEDKTVIDYGCGSGILAIAAVRLGAKKVLAIDCDSNACRIARHNVAVNKAQGKVEVLHSSGILPLDADIVVANILLKPLLALAPRFRQLLSNTGIVMLSGLLKDQGDECLAAYQALFNMESPRYRGDWALLRGQVRGSVRG